MALVDHLLQFSDKQALATGNSTNTLDTKFKNVGTAGLPVILKGHSIAPSSITVAVKLQHSDTEAGTYTDVSTSKAFSAAELAKGSYFPVTTNTKRFIRLAYTVTGTVTAGAISAWIGNEADMRSDYQAVIGPGVPV
ncbi:Bbp16 family capsid cement protein [Acinetobacter puyangensis]|uniref:Bbp16 family capsid cement protein n=1 Tax=Acinetobacter puyangensis TaxID=1096779 RepID=UPI003A4DD203